MNEPKGQTFDKGTRKENRKDQSPNKILHLKVQKTQWGALRGEMT